jgi:hypothetical protein
MTQQVFKKKSRKNESQEAGSDNETAKPTAAEKDSHRASDNKTTKKSTSCAGNNEGTIRLSCDLPRPLHRSLRVAAALSERSMLGMIEALISRHLWNKPEDQIVKEYNKNNDTNP